MVKYYKQWFNIEVNDQIVRAKCIDIEFETGFGPLLLMETRDNHKFWIGRESLLDRKV